MSDRRKSQEPIAHPDRRSERVEAAEAWWALILRVLSFIVGAIILLSQIGQAQDHIYLIVAGVGLCGPVVAQSVATVFAAIRTGAKPE